MKGFLARQRWRVSQRHRNMVKMKQKAVSMRWTPQREELKKKKTAAFVSLSENVRVFRLSHLGGILEQFI